VQQLRHNFHNLHVIYEGTEAQSVTKHLSRKQGPVVTLKQSPMY